MDPGFSYLYSFCVTVDVSCVCRDDDDVVCPKPKVLARLLCPLMHVTLRCNSQQLTLEFSTARIIRTFTVCARVCSWRSVASEIALDFLKRHRLAHVYTRVTNLCCVMFMVQFIIMALARRLRQAF